MSTLTPAGPRTTRRARDSVVATLAALVLAGLLAACSSSASDAPASRDNDAGSDVDAGEEAAPAPAPDRSVIITGELYMTVEDPIKAADQVTDIVQGAAGRVDGRTETAPDEYYCGEATLTLRIPADSVEAVVAELRELGTVDQFSTSTTDVTTQVTDLEAQISTLRASTTRIEGLLTEAQDIDDIIALERELDSRRSELESLEAQQRGLDDQVSMSTIELSLTTEPVVMVDDSPTTFWDGLSSGWNALVAFVSTAVVVLGVLLPWLAVMALITFAVIAAVRARQSRVVRRASAAPEIPEQPTPGS